jgi:hypothetical protein
MCGGGRICQLDIGNSHTDGKWVAQAIEKLLNVRTQDTNVWRKYTQ